jgi:hypothetical protein
MARDLNSAQIVARASSFDIPWTISNKVFGSPVDAKDLGFTDCPDFRLLILDVLPAFDA